MGSVICLSLQNVSICYGSNEAVCGVFMDIHRSQVMAFIGPSGSCMSTALRALDRMNHLIEVCSLRGRMLLGVQDLYARDVDPVVLRRWISMVFQIPNPFPKRIDENIAFGVRIIGYRGDMDELVERTLLKAAIWDETKDEFKESGYALSGGQQQRLCIARAISVKPKVILMDEPLSVLDPISTLKIEEMMQGRKELHNHVCNTQNTAGRPRQRHDRDH